MKPELCQYLGALEEKVIYNYTFYMAFSYNLRINIYYIVLNVNFYPLLAKLKSFDGKKIMLLESLPKANNQQWDKKPYENRVSAITPGSKAFLEGLISYTC